MQASPSLAGVEDHLRRQLRQLCSSATWKMRKSATKGSGGRKKVSMLLNLVSSNTPVKLRKSFESRMPPVRYLSFNPIIENYFATLSGLLRHQGARALGHALGTADTTAARGGALCVLHCFFQEPQRAWLSICRWYHVVLLPPWPLGGFPGDSPGCVAALGSWKS